MKSLHRSFDWLMLSALLALMAIGELLVYSATMGEPGSHWLKQLSFFVLGLIFIAILYMAPTRLLYFLAYPAYALAVAMLLVLMVLKAQSVERWIHLPGGFTLQPSEFAKIALLLALARYLSLKKVALRDLRTLIVPLALFAVPFLLVLNQPDLSTALVFGVLFLTLLFWAGLRPWEIFILMSPGFSILLTSQQLLWALLVIVLVILMWLHRVHLLLLLTTVLINIAAGYSSLLLWNKVLKEHQRARILTFVNPMRDPKGEGYQVIQSKVAIGSGGFWGKGFGNGTQTNLSFLPEEHTDFIFSVLGEQFGFIGCVAVLLLFYLLIYSILRNSVVLRSRFANLVNVGIASILGFHVFINVAMTLGMMPVTGLPLPFLSYGGSFVLTCMVLVGIAMSLRVREEA